MWLLSTDRAELHYFESPEGVPGGYAILSHVWDGDGQEQTFQDIRRLLEHCVTGQTPRDLACAKLRRCCILAERHGYRWVWIDTCCIDKTSSAELSEAINSMFRYYSLAAVCYVYLKTVPTDCDLHSPTSAFRESRWHRRGWTLQELIAPTFLIFVSQEWEVLGTKMELAELLEEITQIPPEVLRQEMELNDISIARRMSWAAERQTKRLEDEAYCLMGIFSVNMPTLYGEGRQAFQRLQEEIMKKSADTSLFYWGRRAEQDELDSILSEEGRRYHDHKDLSAYLLADSPSAFKSCANVSFRDPRLPTASEQYGDVIPTFTTTPYGFRLRVPVIEAYDYTIAILFCSDDAEDQTLGLFLTRCPDASDPSKPFYHPATYIFDFDSSAMQSTRTVRLGDSAYEPHFPPGIAAFVSWRDIYIAHRPPSTIAILPLSRSLRINRTISTPFRIPERQIEALLERGIRLGSVSETPPVWTGDPPVALTFTLDHDNCTMILLLGRCASSSQSSRSERPHWATVCVYDRNVPSTSPPHACLTDHICDWPNSRRLFDLGASENMPRRKIALAFTACPINPLGTLLADISEVADDDILIGTSGIGLTKRAQR